MYVPINPLGYSCIKKLQRDNLWHAYNEPINIYSVAKLLLFKFRFCNKRTESVTFWSVGNPKRYCCMPKSALQYQMGET